MKIRTSVHALLVILLFAGCQKDPADFVNGNFISYRHDLNVGASAKDLLTNDQFTSLTIELQYLSDDYRPAPEVMNHLQSMLESRLNKTGGVTIVSKQIKPSSFSFGVDQVRSIEETSRTVFTRDNRLSVYILYLNGFYAPDSFVLGAAYRNTSIVVFGKSVRDYAAGDPNKKLVFDATVLEHEFCHLLGLVDEGTPAQSPHKDGSNGHHCTNENCLMYYAFLDTDHTSQYSDGLKSVMQLDDACIADLRANGGK